FERLTQQGHGVGLLFQGVSQGGLGGGLLLLRLLLTRLQRGLLLKVLLNLHGERRQQRGEFSLARKLMALRCQLLQAAQVLTLLALACP
ncbi:hypothetical protein NK362_25430, partial [Salmonella enterica]|uniref:hypothetical protein n=1 Tax=Salmonella enterica TaxID=28901 RepID=UPI0022B7302B